jgi:hypothetical protein
MAKKRDQFVEKLEEMDLGPVYSFTTEEFGRMLERITPAQWAAMEEEAFQRSGMTREEWIAARERESGPLGVIDDLFVMLRFFKEGAVEFVWTQVNEALKRSEELSAADPVRWRQFLQECNKIAPGSIPSGMVQ